jgi:putative endonuclease
VGRPRDVGFAGEGRAARHLEQLGFRVLDRNYSIRAGEIDLVVTAPDGTLCFVEVRVRRGHDYGTPAETVTWKKQRRIVAAARHYLATRVRGREPVCRFDVVEIEGDELRLMTDAFRLDG